ncbi:MAG: hypothetical protein JXL85_02455 [Bacilli bacterium]|nr:hypothetical protein [Bacilli bacterium]
MLEKEMYPVIKEYLIKEGYTVKAEITNADLVAKKEDHVIVVEMKTSFTTKLIYQGIKRTHYSDFVYLAIPKPNTKGLHSANYKEKLTIVRRLELGLILVQVEKGQVEVVLDPKTYHMKTNKKKRNKLAKEFELRKTSLNVGGISKTKVITAYKELTLLVLDELKGGPKTTAYLKEQTKRKKVLDILQKNYYGWFERVKRGVYQITPLGLQAWVEYKDVIKEMQSLKKSNQESIAL